LSQHVRGVGERHLSDSQKKAFRKNPDSTIVFLDDDWSIAVVSIVTQSPLEFVSGAIVGLKYDAVKDFIRWSTPEGYDIESILQHHIQLILNLGQYYIGEMNRKN
jgi:hypothetical protein